MNPLYIYIHCLNEFDIRLAILFPYFLCDNVIDNCTDVIYFVPHLYAQSLYIRRYTPLSNPYILFITIIIYAQLAARPNHSFNESCSRGSIAILWRDTAIEDYVDPKR